MCIRDRNYGLLQEAVVTSRTSNFRRCSREQYFFLFSSTDFNAILRESSFCTIGGVFFTKRRPWPNSLKTTNIIVPRFCFGRESCSCCLRRISRRLWRGSSFCTFGGVLYKTKTLAKFVENSQNIIVPRFCFRLESCLVYFQAISRRFWRDLRFWVFGLRFVPTHHKIAKWRLMHVCWISDQISFLFRKQAASYSEVRTFGNWWSFVLNDKYWTPRMQMGIT